MKLAEFKKLLESIETEDFEVIFKENQIVVEAKGTQPEILKTIQLFVKDNGAVQKTANGWVVDTSKVGSAHSLWKILVSMYADQYQIKVVDDYTLQITKKAGELPNNVTYESKNETKANEGNSVDDILAFIKKAGFDAKADGNTIEVTGKNSDLEKLADDLDANFDNLEIVLDLGKLTITIK